MHHQPEPHLHIALLTEALLGGIPLSSIAGHRHPQATRRRHGCPPLQHLFSVRILRLAGRRCTSTQRRCQTAACTATTCVAARHAGAGGAATTRVEIGTASALAGFFRKSSERERGYCSHTALNSFLNRSIATRRRPLEPSPRTSSLENCSLPTGSGSFNEFRPQREGPLHDDLCSKCLHWKLSAK